jgi:hypothetical protein
MAFDTYNPLWYINSSGQLTVYDGGEQAKSVLTVTEGVDSTVEVCRRGTGTTDTDLYVNGVFDKSSLHVDIVLKPTSLYIGQNGGGGSFFNGIIYEISFYNRALTAPEISEMHAHPLWHPSNPRLIVEPRRTWFIPVAAAPGGSIVPLLMATYRRRRQ